MKVGDLVIMPHRKEKFGIKTEWGLVFEGKSSRNRIPVLWCNGSQTGEVIYEPINLLKIISKGEKDEI